MPSSYVPDMIWYDMLSSPRYSLLLVLKNKYGIVNSDWELLVYSVQCIPQYGVPRKESTHVRELRELREPPMQAAIFPVQLQSNLHST
jgi:hypothetical protein